MTLDDDQIKQLTLDLLKTKTRRDKQSKIGPSGIGNPCDYCLAISLKGGQYNDENKWWLGARVGTAIHSLMEHEVGKHVDTPMAPEYNVLKDANTESRLFITHLPGYGNIYGNSDLRLTTGNLIDWKTSTRDKIKRYRLDGIPYSYIVQQNLYAYAWNQITEGAVEKCSLVFIARDGTSDADVLVVSFDYDPAIVELALERLAIVWEWVQAGKDIEDLASDDHCFACSMIYRRI